MNEQVDTSAIDDAIAKMVTAVALADALSITPAAITEWKKNGLVPVGQCIAVEKLTGIPCERLNPTCDWAYLRRKPSKRPPAM